MDNDKIKELISVRYPNPKPFWDNNKEWILNLVSEVEKEMLLKINNTKDLVINLVEKDKKFKGEIKK
jgi:hypothetical protein